MHKSCHGLRGLHLGSCSERMDPHFSTEENLLNAIDGLELMSLNRKDECCGFGGTFSVFEEAISVKMGKDRMQDHIDSEVEVITGADHSCLMHLEGLINR
ncbi:MAG: (Fe-S)-binding protein [Polaribacter sp.]|uniref:(Fe-S)-binding protein n=1 Tax=Polaribacter sp. TaxID=1920175 RepID=UPI003264C716